MVYFIETKGLLIESQVGSPVGQALPDDTLRYVRQSLTYD